ncbi:single-stranded DNA-binding protein [Pediococcus acidilactici]|uniref:single-stranded DNA-binding protein n=1 Tax=Pediococcus acidilactici TaxID=1254 RepID=UPI003B432089
MINTVALVGRLTKDPEMRYTAAGVPVANFNLAVNRQFTNQNGEREADFINCLIWRKPAENFCDFTHKGSLVGISGRVQTRSYTNQKDEKVYVTEVVAERFSLLESKEKDKSNSQPHSPVQESNQSKSKHTNPNDPFANGGQSIDITDDDLPF